MRWIYTLLFISFSILNLSSQYSDYIGAGHNDGISVSSSDQGSIPENSIDASGLDLEIQSASRFLAHATMGFTIDDIQSLTELGYGSWIDRQLELPESQYAIPTLENIFELYEQCIESLGEDECNMVFFLDQRYFRYAWWDNVMRSPDKLRQRVALALSEILVISDLSELNSYPHGIAHFYDILTRNAFGNYKTLLTEVSLNPSMGFYLSHINNPKTNEELNIHPDENYAREIMQLFSVGLYELNNDGSRKIDTQTGLWIPTYDNDDIKGLAKVFTGLSGSKWADAEDQRPVQFGRNFRRYSLLDAMTMYEQWHEPGPKTIVGDYTIEADSGMQEVELAIDHLFNHDNVGPFIAYRLIQRLVKSNPTPEYVDRVSNIFNNNGSGTRGDLKSVVKAIFLDEEAMQCYWFGEMENGQLRPPIQRYTQMLSALKAKSNIGKFWNSGFFYQELTAQHPMSSPTVFNFYQTDYVPNSDFAYYNIVGPEYQILNSSTSSNYVNYMLLTLMREYLFDNYDIRLPKLLNEAFLIPYVVDQEQYEAFFSDELWMELGFYPEEMVDYLDILLANGQMSEASVDAIVKSIQSDDIFTESEKAYYALFMLMINPDYLIMK